MKKCKQCEETKSNEDFYIYKKTGALRGKCKSCCNKNSMIDYGNKKEEYNARSKRNYEKNRHEINEKHKEYNKHYESSGKRKKNHDKRMRLDNVYKAKKTVRCFINNSMKRNNYTKDKRTEEILGCSIDYFKEYLEALFEEWMSWNNKGMYNGEFNYGWDIDHITPLAKAKTYDDVIKLNHYTNLQPLCSKVNREIKR